MKPSSLIGLSVLLLSLSIPLVGFADDICDPTPTPYCTGTDLPCCDAPVDVEIPELIGGAQ